MEPGGEPIQRRRGAFKKLHRLRRQADFQRVLRRRCMATDAPMAVYVDRNGLRWSRIGLSVSRRTGCAVVRNRLKRLAREAFRLSRDELPVGIDVVCILKSPEPATRDRYRAVLTKLVRAAVAKLERQAR
jgi:ribonuclease P protein component